MKNLIFIASFLLILSCNSKDNRTMSLIPLPNQIHITDEVYTLSQETRVFCNNQKILEGFLVFNELIASFSGKGLAVNPDSSNSGNDIEIILNDSIPEEGYELIISDSKISVHASQPAGVFYAFQTIRQMCPKEINTSKNAGSFEWKLQGCEIKDSPAFKWRGMMLDVSRHFFNKEEVKQLIDQLAFHKINTFHWHLADDQGWRIEIKKYPKLTEIGSWRVDREQLPWNSRPKQKGEKATYGGFYTQEEIKEVVDFARKRFITIVPEIEMPGHTTAALAAYPEFSCTGGPFTVIPGGVWPITDIYCAGKDETFRFIEDVLTEVMALFPSKYIHIGGDEATKDEWEKCRRCQARIKKENLKDEKELQSYFTKRIEKFLSQNQRILIGWDEILEGGLAPGAAVMSWRGFEGGIEAAKNGHDVVMSPTSYCYIDYYQGPVDSEPLAIGSYLPVSKVYKFNPVPEELDKDKVKHILGGQANLWTEFIPDKKQMQYMIFPRMAAMSEVLWTNPEHKDWKKFALRLENMLETYKAMGINYAESMYSVKLNTSFDSLENIILVELTTEAPNTNIFYTTDGTEPNEKSSKFDKAFKLDKTTEIKSVVIKNGIPLGKGINQKINIHKAAAKKVEYLTPYSDKYPGSGISNLVNCTRGSRNFGDGQWQGFEGNDMEIIIDLKNSETFNKLTVGCLHATGSWIFAPKEIIVHVSEDKKSFQPIVNLLNDVPLTDPPKVIDYSMNLNGAQGRYLKIIVKNQGVAPIWHDSHGQKVWLFVDEVILE